MKKPFYEDYSFVTKNVNSEINFKDKLGIFILNDSSQYVEFPEKYKGAIIKAMDLCTVKKHILNPPEFEIMCN